jgi:hypothetical protein
MLRALGQIRRMRGGAQAQLMRCSDGHYYLVKSQNNPQHTRVLVNELLGTRLAARLGLTRLEKGLGDRVLDELSRETPPEWYTDDYDALLRLHRRRTRVPELILESKKSRRINQDER